MPIAVWLTFSQSSSPSVLVLVCCVELVLLNENPCDLIMLVFLVTDAATPGSWLPFEPHDVPAEGICLHRLQGTANALLIGGR
jgi:hypothetical protein